MAGSELSTRSRQPGSAYAHFLEVLSVCHTVVVETDDVTGDKSYQVGTHSKAYKRQCSRPIKRLT